VTSVVKRRNIASDKRDIASNIENMVAKKKIIGIKRYGIAPKCILNAIWS